MSASTTTPPHDAAQPNTYATAYRLLLAYDGGDFHGWQAQAGLRTVQQELHNTIARTLGQPASLIGASRTDAGVHAQGQVALLRLTAPLPMTMERFQRVIASRLPADIALLRVAPAAPDFHPSLNAIGKLYRYRVFAAVRRPVEWRLSQHSWQVWTRLDVERMRAAARSWVGTHDFLSFASAGMTRRTTIRTITRFVVERRFHELFIDVEGDGFLYHQVRNMVGTLIEIGRGHWPVEQAAAILAARDRRAAGPQAPAHGLCLQYIRYNPIRTREHAA